MSIKELLLIWTPSEKRTKLGAHQMKDFGSLHGVPIHLMKLNQATLRRKLSSWVFKWCLHVALGLKDRFLSFWQLQYSVQSQVVCIHSSEMYHKLPHWMVYNLMGAKLHWLHYQELICWQILKLDSCPCLWLQLWDLKPIPVAPSGMLRIKTD